MGTRHLIAVVDNGEYKVAQYGQWDGYPDGQGKDIAKFLSDVQNVAALRKGIKHVSWITPEEHQDAWVSCGAQRDAEWVDMEVSNKFGQQYPHLSRDCGSDILDYAARADADHPLRVTNSVNFAADSLFCEWAYVINLDNNTLEVYRGFNTEPLALSERFSTLPRDGKYYPVRHLITHTFDSLQVENIKSKNFVRLTKAAHKEADPSAYE